MDLTANDLLEMAPDLACEGGKEGLSTDAGDPRDRAIDASGPLWPLALNGWMPLDRLPPRHAEATAVPAPSSGAAS